MTYTPMQELKSKRKIYDEIIERRMAGTMEADEFMIIEKRLNVECSKLKLQCGIFTGAARARPSPAMINSRTMLSSVR